MIRGFLNLPWKERRLLCEVGVILCAYRVALWLLPLRAISRSPVTHVVGREADNPRHQSAHELARAVTRMSNRLPWATCLTQALTCQFLLARRGFRSQLHIGVEKSERGFGAHAWLMHDGEVLLGQPQHRTYTTILTLGAERG